MKKTSPHRLAPRMLRRRAREVKLVLTDCDGVLTDTGVYYSAEGEVMKRFSIRDGMGIERLRADGVETAIISGEVSGSVRRRAQKLRMPYLYLGVKDKKEHLAEICRETGLRPDQMAYIGDDVNDLEIIRQIGIGGITAAPADAVPAVTALVHFCCTTPGGHGAFREFAEWLLTLRRKS